jgi:hypothetical protein
LFLLFATGVIDTGGKFGASVIDIGGKLSPVSTTLAKLVAKFAAGVVDTSGKFAAGVVDSCDKFAPVSLILVVHLDLQISPRILRKKFETVLMGYSGAAGKLIHFKNQK